MKADTKITELVRGRADFKPKRYYCNTKFQCILFSVSYDTQFEIMKFNVHSTDNEFIAKRS